MATRSNYNKTISATTLRVGEVRFSYVYVMAPHKSAQDGKEKYSIQILLPKDDRLAKAMIDSAVEAAVENGITSKWNGKRPVAAKLKLPVRDGDEEYPDDPTYHNMWFFNATANADRRPGVCILEMGELVAPMEMDDIYSGCWGAAVINFYPYSVSGNTGVAVGLNNVIKTRDDERLGGGKRSVETDFGDLVDGGSVLD